MIPLSDTKGSGSFPFWVVVIILLNCIAFFLELTSPSPDSFAQKYALIPSLLKFSDFKSLLPLVSSQFLHAGFLHIISNMWFLWIFGDNAQQRFGFILFPLVYLVSGILGGLAQYFFMPDSTIPIIGASGAVAGILGAYFAFYPGHVIKTIVPIFGFFTISDLPAAFVLVYWFVTQIFSGTASLVNSSYALGGVAYFAHIAGFLFGFLVAKIFNLFSVQKLEVSG